VVRTHPLGGPSSEGCYRVTVYVSDFELVVRCLAVMVTFLTASTLLWLVATGVEPTSLYAYNATAWGVFTVVRILILWLAFQSPEDQAEVIVWLGPVNAVCTCIVGFGVLLMTLYRVKVARAQLRISKTTDTV